MRKVFFVLFLLLSLLSCSNKTKEVSNVQASSYIVIEQSSNKILEGNNYYTQRSVASISKIMTAIIVIETIDINKLVIVPNDISKVDGSSIYLKVNEQISIEKLLYGLLLRSGNDAAITLALSISKSVGDFVLLMNQKARLLNMKDTTFNNPHGLDSDDNGNISSAYDMAILYSYCLQNETFSKITSSKEYNTFINKNKLISSYKYCTGGKTGYTKKAKRTLISSASKDNINLIIVTLNCGNDFETHKNIYEHYFNNYTSIKILNKGINNLFDKTFILDKNYYFITDLDNLTLSYHINLKEKYVEITLFNIDKKVVDYIKVMLD